MNDEVKTAVRRKKALGRKCWQLAMRRQKKDICKRTEREKKKRKVKRAKSK